MYTLYIFIYNKTRKNMYTLKQKQRNKLSGTNKPDECHSSHRYTNKKLTISINSHKQ